MERSDSSSLSAPMNPCHTEAIRQTLKNPITAKVWLWQTKICFRCRYRQWIKQVNWNTTHQIRTIQDWIVCLISQRGKLYIQYIISFLNPFTIAHKTRGIRVWLSASHSTETVLVLDFSRWWFLSPCLLQKQVGGREENRFSPCPVTAAGPGAIKHYKQPRN